MVAFFAACLFIAALLPGNIFCMAICGGWGGCAVTSIKIYLQILHLPYATLAGDIAEKSNP
jgi:hypothetical protein